MRTRSVPIGILTLLGGVVLAVVCAHADSGSGPSKFSGTAAGAGSGLISRTISDAQPNEPNGAQSVQSTVVNVPVSSGQNSNTIATNMRDAINANSTLIAAGYSAHLIFAPSGLARLKVTRQVGTYTSNDAVSGTLTGYGVNPDVFTSTDAPGISPMGIVSLFGALPALYLLHRRKKRAA